MADTSLPDFLAALLREYSEPTDPSIPAVLHAVHDNLAEDEASIEAVVSRYHGAYIRCTVEGNEPRSGIGTPNTTFLEPLKILCDHRNMPIEVAIQGDTFTLTSTRFGSNTGASLTILNVLTTLLSEEMDQELVVLAYEIGSLDEAAAQLLWDACGLLSTYAPPRLRTFVPIAAGRLVVAIHCNPVQAARLVVRDGEFYLRDLRKVSHDLLADILRDIDQPLVLFLGAGASASSGMPDGNRVRDYALGVLTGETADPERAIELFRDYLTTHSQWMPGERDVPPAVWARDLTLERVMREEFRRLNGTSRAESKTVQKLRRDADAALEHYPDGREALWDLAAILPRLVIGTVNFDQLIEEGMAAEHVVLASPDEFENERDALVSRLAGGVTPVPVLKVHGTIERADTIVADIDSTEGGLPRKIADTLSALVRDQNYLTWVWVGCSMRDVDIEQWLRTIDGAKEIKEFWVDPLPPASVTRYAERRRYWEWAGIKATLKDRQITETSDVFLTALLAHARTLQDG